ncbi:unnamed protein product [Bursaphelenchus okinawaensis]|uniref:Uncharacterized protein n=1 Tax=Bursaphelenchus okinawaensis TaxID=465554 RepID=A0A811KU85_9BILA|nr:unnamed protein product [Bursaphelenchus okinawaensis]CAG9113309.1 unnamed protein product [Bursaphelenchus okinawaensis]
MDFKSLCYKNIIFRLKNECWSEAFSRANNRILPDINLALDRLFVRCCFTGIFAFPITNRYVLIGNLGLAGIPWFHFVPVTSDFLHINILNRGSQVIIYCEDDNIILDVDSGRIYDRLRSQDCMSDVMKVMRHTTLGILICIKLETMLKATLLNNLNVNCRIKYLAFLNFHGEVIVIDVDTMRKKVIYTMRFGKKEATVLSESDSIFIKDGPNAVIYSLETGDLLCDITDYDKGGRWLQIAHRVFVNNETGTVNEIIF